MHFHRWLPSHRLTMGRTECSLRGEQRTACSQSEWKRWLSGEHWKSSWTKVCTFAAQRYGWRQIVRVHFFFARNKWPQIKRMSGPLMPSTFLSLVSIALKASFIVNAFSSHTTNSGIMSYLRSAGIFLISFCVRAFHCSSPFIRFF